MAQPQNTKVNLSSAKVGMQKDTHPSQLQETQYTHAFNANIESETGDILNITNEKSNILASKFKSGFKVIGYENDIDTNSTYFFLTNPNTGVGELGVIESNQNTNDLKDLEVNCTDCDKINELPKPLEDIAQTPLQEYKTLLTDADGYLNVDTNTCTPFTKGTGFNFNVAYPIKSIVIKNEKSGKTLYFTDNYNPPRHINVSNIAGYFVQNVPCNDDVTTTCINFEELRIFKLFNIPKLTPVSIELGGRLKMGVYEFLIAYCDAIGNEISPYYSITNPISVFDSNNTILEQQNLADRTGLAIRLEVSNLDNTYSHYKIAVIQTADIEGATRYFVEGIHPISDNSVLYTTEQGKLTTSIDKLLISPLNVEKTESLSESNNILFQSGVTIKKEINLQPVVNLLGQFVKWQTHIAGEELYSNGVLGSKYLSYNRDEVVPLSIRFLMDGGYETPIYPLISRALITGEDEIINTVTNDDARSIVENVKDCNSNNRTKRWQFYNTAFTSADSQCSVDDPFNVIQVEETLTKTCIVPIPDQVGPSPPATSISITTNTDDYTTLEDYITDNSDNCDSSVLTPEICAVLSGDYTALACASDPLSGYNVLSVTTEESIVVDSIVNPVETKVKKVFPSDYAPVKPPKNACSVFARNDENKFFTDPELYNGTYFRVYERDFNRSNEFCTYADEIATTPSGDNYNDAIFGNYYYDAVDTNLLQTSYNIPASGVAAGFYNKLHKGALWFVGEITNGDGFILDLSKYKKDTANKNDSLSSGVTTQRISIFKTCSSTTAIYSKIVDIDSGEYFLFEKTGTSDLTIKEASGATTVLPGDWFTGEEYFVAIDSIIGYEANTGTAGSVFVVKPIRGCYTISQRDIEYSRIDITWDLITFSKKIVYTATCLFDQPIVQSCRALPFKKGTFAYWESEESYPDNPELYDSSNLLVSESLIPESVRAEFEEVFSFGTSGGKYVLSENANFTCKPIRHFRFPDNKVAPFMSYNKQSPFSSSIIYPLGITVDEDLIAAFLDVAVENNLITQEDRIKISGYEIFRGDLTLDRGVIASGLLYDMREYEENNKKIKYSNYPFNTYKEDVLNLDSSTPNLGESNTNYTFHSPETDYYRNTLPTELTVQGYMYGNSRGHFDEVKDHPRWVILSNKGRKLASTLATLEVAGEIAIEAAQAFSNAQWWAGFAGISTGAPALIASGIIAGVGIGSAVIYKHSQYRYQWLKIFRDFGSPQNFAYYYFAEGHYNHNLIDEITEGNSLRGLHIAKYLKDGRFRVTNEITGERLDINNIDRERSVFLSFGEDSPLVYPTNYSLYDGAYSSSLTYQSESGKSGSGRSAEIIRNIASPYVALKNYLPSQHGTINSIKWLSTGYVGDLRTPTANCLSIFGGDTYISRHTLKRKMSLFLVTEMKQADLTPFDYKFYSNIGKNPRFYCSYEQNLDYTGNRGKVFPDLNSTYSFDNLKAKGNYVAPPSKFYLYYYGVPNFLAETRINTNYRYAGKEISRNFFPQVGDLGAWTQETAVPIREPNVFLYNNEYSKQITQTRSRVLSNTYNKELSDKVQDLPNGIIASLPDNTENSIYDPWLIYRPLDLFEFPTSYGKLKDILDIEDQAILARFENTSVLYNKVDTKIDDGSRPELATLGGNTFFQRRSTSFHNTNLGYGGTQNFAYSSNEFGHFYADAKRGQVLMVPSGGNGMVEISAMAGDKPSGMRSWFKEHLPFKILKHIPDVDIDNPYNGVGLTMGWDSRHKRVFLTKKDYIPKSDCIEFLTGTGFVINNSSCGGDQVSQCPEGYTYNETTGVCERVVTTGELCPEGYVYNSLLERCELVEIVEIQIPDVIATPSATTITEGDTVTIDLTSSLAGTTFTWTVFNDGTSGPVDGSGNTIVDTITGTGSTTYTITPTNGGCEGDPITVVISVNILVITNNTKINIWFDNSGSMDTTLAPLRTMRDTILKPCLLPAYNNDSALYDSRVEVLNFDSKATGYERYIDLLSTMSTDPQIDKVINLAFQDESTPYSAEVGWNGVFESTALTDINTLITNLNSSPAGSLIGIIFRVSTNNNQFAGFRLFVETLHTGSGQLNRSEIGYQLDVTAADTPQNYANLIINALNGLGFTLDPC